MSILSDAYILAETDRIQKRVDLIQVEQGDMITKYGSYEQITAHMQEHYNRLNAEKMQLLVEKNTWATKLTGGNFLFLIICCSIFSANLHIIFKHRWVVSCSSLGSFVSGRLEIINTFGIYLYFLFSILICNFLCR